MARPATQLAAITVQRWPAYIPSRPALSFMQDSVRAQCRPAAAWGPGAAGDPTRRVQQDVASQPGPVPLPPARERGGREPRSEARTSALESGSRSAEPMARPRHSQAWRPAPLWQRWIEWNGAPGPWGARVKSDWSGQLRPISALRALTSRNKHLIFLK